MIVSSTLKQEMKALWELLSPLQTYRKEFWMIFYTSALVNFLMLAPMVYLLQIFDRIMISQSLILTVICNWTISLYVCGNAFFRKN